MTVFEYLLWVEGALYEGADPMAREALQEWVYDAPEFAPARSLETWGTSEEAEQGQLALMELAGR